MKKFALIAVVLSTSLMPALADNGPDKGKSAFDKLKTLVGTWKGKFDEGTEGMEAQVTYRLTGAGSALLETIEPGTPHEMVTMYHMDGDDVKLTHYCAAGNQPMMKLSADSTDKVLKFEFAGGSNINDQVPHMHRATIEFISDDHIKSTWVAFTGEKEAMSAVFDLQRVK